jgi:hypothetical protein
MARATALAALAITLLLPAAAQASHGQISILQDDAAFAGGTSHNAKQSMNDAKLLGVDMIRATLSWEYVSPRARANKKPAGFDIGDPDSPGYHWGAYDQIVNYARSDGLKVLLTISGPIPHWASASPRKCSATCKYKPRPDLFGRFSAAVARHFRGRVAMYSVWNEPNLGKWLLPQQRMTPFGEVDYAAKAYRKLWLAAYHAIAKHNPANRNHVLFGETAGIAEPLVTLGAALCLDPSGRPLRGVLRKLQGCSRHPAKLNVAGIAHHPYNRAATGSWRTQTRTSTSLSIAYMPRLHRLLRRAAHYGRIPRGRGAWVTEFGFQSRPPDRVHGIPLKRQARVLNESERLFWGDRTIRSTSQYELYDARRAVQYNTGLRFKLGGLKPAYDAYRMPLVVTRLGRNKVEVWGGWRLANAGSVIGIEARNKGFLALAKTNSRGYFRKIIRRKGAAKLIYRLRKTILTPSFHFERLYSRRAAAGGRVHYAPEIRRR